MSAHRRISSARTLPSANCEAQPDGTCNDAAAVNSRDPRNIAKLGKRAVLKLWNTARHADGEALRLFEVEAAAARWCDLFDEPPPTLPGRAAVSSRAKLKSDPSAAAQPVLLNKSQVAQLLGIAPSTLNRRVANGKFPKPLKMGKRRLVWPEQQVQNWLAHNRPAEPTNPDSD